MTQPVRPWHQGSEGQDATDLGDAHMSRSLPWSGTDLTLLLIVGGGGSWLASFNPVGVFIWIVVSLVIVGAARNGRRNAAIEHKRQLEAERIFALRAQEIESYYLMNPREFEHAVAYLCQRDGCLNVQVVGGAGDLGADVIATTPDGRRVVIQCKRYSPTNKVGSPDLQRFGGTCYSVHNAQVAVLVTTSTFTRQAIDYGTRQSIRLYDTTGLSAWASRTGPAPWM